MVICGRKIMSMCVLLLHPVEVKVPNIENWNENDDFDCILEVALENPNHWHNEHVIVVNRELIKAVSSRVGFGCAQTSFYVFMFLYSIALITVRIPIWVMAPKKIIQTPMWAVAPKPFVMKVYEILAGSSKGPLESRIPTQNKHHCSNQDQANSGKCPSPLNHRKKMICLFYPILVTLIDKGFCCIPWIHLSPKFWLPSPVKLAASVPPCLAPAKQLCTRWV